MALPTTTYPTIGSLYVSSGNNNSTPVYMQASLTSFPNFPNTFATHANANLTVNGNADGVAFVDINSLAKQLVVPTEFTIASGVTRQIKWTLEAHGDMSYNPTTGDILIPQTGWYTIQTVGITTDISDQNVFFLAKTDGAGTITGVIQLAASMGILRETPCSWVGYLTLGETIGFFVNNNTGAPATYGDNSDTVANFSIKYIP